MHVFATACHTCMPVADLVLAMACHAMPRCLLPARATTAEAPLKKLHHVVAERLMEGLKEAVSG